MASQHAHQRVGLVDSASGYCCRAVYPRACSNRALIWVGTACLLNARRCGRTHCRYRGPYYLTMIAPVLVLASGIISAGFYGWLGLGVLIFAGSKIIWWVTEWAWGKFS